MKANTMSGLLVLMAGILFVSSKPTSVGDTDLVAEILQAIEGREEMSRVVGYLKASRDELLKELPLFNPGKFNVLLHFYDCSVICSCF